MPRRVGISAHQDRMQSFRGAYPHLWVDTVDFFGDFGVAHSETTRGTTMMAASAGHLGDCCDESLDMRKCGRRLYTTMSRARLR